MIPFKPLDFFTPYDQWAKVINNNYKATNTYIDLFFDASTKRIIAPIDTSVNYPLVKSGKAQYVQMVVDNMVVKKQYINRYSALNRDASDNQFLRAYMGSDTSTRLPVSLENDEFGYVDAIQPYYKINNDGSVAFNAVTLGQELQIIFDSSVSTFNKFSVLLDPYNENTSAYDYFTVNAADASTTWVKILAVELDNSLGTSWIISEYGGNITFGSGDVSTDLNFWGDEELNFIGDEYGNYILFP